MTSDWATVESLIRQLGSVRAAANEARASDLSRAAIDQAISEAAEAVSLTIDEVPGSTAVAAAAEALDVAAEVVAALGSEEVRSRRLIATSSRLRARAAELIRQCQQASSPEERSG